MLIAYAAMLLLGQHPVESKGARDHDLAREVRNLRDDLLNAREVADFQAERIFALELEVKALEQRFCHCLPPKKPTKPVVAPTPPAQPAPVPIHCWREIGGVWMYGYQDGPVFRYTHFVPPAIQCGPGGCP